ncbi:MAG: LPS-assembly protein LptD [Treponema sp.]|nr:LPS-assembly protein LptD [Treponema sp.]
MKRFALLAVIFAGCFFPAAQRIAAQQAASQQAALAGETAAQQEAAQEDVDDSTAAQQEAAAQQAVSQQAVSQQAADDKSSALQTEQVLELDIKTSTLMELASWCRSLGLSEGGTRDELANRLRSYFKLPAAGGTVSENAKTIIIESARSTEYFTLEVVNEEYARLTGDVSVSLKDGDAVHRITAWEILYNRTRNIMTASGGVEYVKEEGNTVETFKGDSITVNLDNWSSIFLNGISERSITTGDSAYRFAGSVISRSGEDVTVLTGAEITNGQNPDALWSLNASKLWLLPGSDWAVLNAVLKVGTVPVLWLPFFIYPSDEIVFHPVLGSRAREGVFLQTTTYLLGRPKSSTSVENSITRIFGSTPDGEKVREGLFLRTTGKKTVSTDEPRLSVLFDAYTNLGYYLGSELYLPRMNNFGAFNLSLGLGLTRNIYQVAYGSSPFARYDGKSDWNSSYLFKLLLPVRYRMEMTGSLSFGQGSLSWSIPMYSDPYVNRDFTNRSEVLDWLAMLRESGSAATDVVTDSSISSYEMRLSGSFSPQVSGLSPLVSSFSVSGISSSLAFKSRPASPAPAIPASPANPDYLFFFPDKFTILSLSASVGGTPFSNAAVSGLTRPNAAPPDSVLPAEPIPPWEDPEPDSQPVQSVNDPYNLKPPVLGQRFDIFSAGGPRYTVSYSLGPSAASELQFFNDRGSNTGGAYNWNNPKEIDWSDVSSLMTRVKSDASVGITMSQPNNAYSGSLRFTGTGSWQNWNYLNEDANTDIGAARKRAYNETYITTSYIFSASVRPFFRSAVWGNTSFSYDLKGLLAKTTFDGTNVTDTMDAPQWNWDTGDWTDGKLDTNAVSARIEASVMDQVQSISISTVLPPKKSQLAGNAVFRAALFSAWTSETRIRNTILEPFDNVNRVVQPIYFTESLKFSDWASFDQSLTYDPLITGFSSLTSSLNLWKFNAKYLMTYIAPYTLNLDPSTTIGWIQSGDKSFSPQELSFSISNSFPKTALWNNGPLCSLNVGSSLIFDLQRYTYSKMTFSLGLEMDISNFMNIQFSTTSENAQMYKYFPFFTNNIELPSGTETNFLFDLLNSFRFDSDNLRRHSAFKLKSFSLNVIHNLGDWNATLGITLSPYLDTNSSVPSWKFNNIISFTVKWVPIEEIRTEIGVDKDKITFK